MAATSKGLDNLSILAVSTEIENRPPHWSPQFIRGYIQTAKIIKKAKQISDRGRESFMNTPCPPVHAAIMYARIDLAEKLIKNVDFKPDALWTSDSKGFENVTPAFIAVYRGDLNAFKTLLKFKFNPDSLYLEGKWEDNLGRKGSGTILNLIEKMDDVLVRKEFLKVLKVHAKKNPQGASPFPKSKIDEM